MTKKLAFIGGGSTGLSAAGYFGMQGFECRLYDTPAHDHHLRAVATQGGVHLTGAITGFGAVQVVRNVEAAVADADVIFVHVVAQRHEEIARAIAPHLHAGQHVVICPGNLGCFVFQSAFEQLGAAGRATLSVMQGNLFPCRIIGDARVIIAFPMARKTLAAYPARDTAAILAGLAGILEVDAGRNAFDCALNSTNFVVHIAASVLSASAAEKIGSRFNIYEEGIGDAVLKCAERVENERRRIVLALGYAPAPSPLGLMRDVARYAEHPYLEYFHTLRGPDGTAHRYFTEDSLCNGAFLASLGRRLAIPTPMMDGLLTITGTLHQTDYFRTGRTLENLGFGSEMSLDDILAAL